MLAAHYRPAGQVGAGRPKGVRVSKISFGKKAGAATKLTARKKTAAGLGRPKRKAAK
jgi:hypothetical protein